MRYDLTDVQIWFGSYLKMHHQTGYINRLRFTSDGQHSTQIRGLLDSSGRIQDLQTIRLPIEVLVSALISEIPLGECTFVKIEKVKDAYFVEWFK